MSTKRKKKPGVSEATPKKRRKAKQRQAAEKPVATPMPPRKPSKASRYSPALGRAICKMLASGMSLNEVCKRPRMPYEQTVRGWAGDPGHPFSASYVRAREIGYLRMADDLLEIADDASKDWVQRQNQDGTTSRVVDHDHIARARLRVDTRKWVLSKALPKIYGDKVLAEHVGAIQAVETRDVVKDHLEGLSRRFAEGLKVIEGGVPAKLNGANGSAAPAEDALNEASAKWVRENGRRDH